MVVLFRSNYRGYERDHFLELSVSGSSFDFLLPFGLTLDLTDLVWSVILLFKRVQLLVFVTCYYILLLFPSGIVSHLADLFRALVYRMWLLAFGTNSSKFAPFGTLNLSSLLDLLRFSQTILSIELFLCSMYSSSDGGTHFKYSEIQLW